MRYPRGMPAVSIALLLVTPLAGCREVSPAAESAASPPPAGARETPTASSKPPGHVRLDASQMQQVQIEALSERAPADTLKATGTIEFDGDRLAKVIPPVAGQVQGLAVKVGDVVHKDNALFVLSSREVAAAVADRAASQKDLDLAEKTHAMTQDLFEHQVASRIALQQSESELAKARSKLEQAEEVLQVLGVDAAAGDTGPSPRIPVRAPIGGTVIERNVTNGQFVAPDNPPLLTIADLSTVWIQADIFERDLRYVAVGQKADVIAAAYPDDRFSAQVSLIGAVVDSQTRTAKVRFLVTNAGMRLKPGMFTSINLYVSQPATFVSMPVKAVFVENGHTFAYVQSGQGEFARQEVQVAPSSSGRLRVLSGVNAGDHVIADGVLLLRQLESDSAGQ